MNSRVEAARQAVADAMIEHGPDGHIDGYEEITDAALAASDAVMFSDEAVERAARSFHNLGVKDQLWTDRSPEVRELYREDVRAVIAALKGDGA